MPLARPFIFWIAVLAAFIAAIVVLREVLLPFVAGMVLAYLLNPVAVRIERLGLSRRLATHVSHCGNTMRVHSMGLLHPRDCRNTHGRRRATHRNPG